MCGLGDREQGVFYISTWQLNALSWTLVPLLKTVGSQLCRLVFLWHKEETQAHDESAMDSWFGCLLRKFHGGLASFSPHFRWNCRDTGISIPEAPIFQLSTTCCELRIFWNFVCLSRTRYIFPRSWVIVRIFQVVPRQSLLKILD